MEFLREVNDRFSVSLSHPDIDDFERLAATGYSAVVNLREDDEPGQALTPQRENDVAVKCGMFYIHMPISEDSLNDKRVDEFRECVASLPGRILVHSGTGKRSTAFTVMHVASEKGLSGEEAVEQAHQLGIKSDGKSLDEFMRHYVDGHSVDIHHV